MKKIFNKVLIAFAAGSISLSSCTNLDETLYSDLNESNIDITTAILIVQNLVPVGVQLESISFSGTFEFSGGTTLEYDAQKGFADDAQSIGGYLGLVGGSTPNSSGQTPSLYTAVLGKASIGRMILGKS